MRQKFVLIILYFISFFSCIAQSDLKTTALNRITLIRKDTTYQFFVKKLEKGYIVKDGFDYYWYKKDTILITRGGFDGKVLNGFYKVFYPNKNIKESGLFENGVKVGEWKSWNDNGKLLELYYWKNGKRQGKFILFDESGGIKQEGKYNRDTILVRHNG